MIAIVQFWTGQVTVVRIPQQCRSVAALKYTAYDLDGMQTVGVLQCALDWLAVKELRLSHHKETPHFLYPYNGNLV